MHDICTAFYTSLAFLYIYSRRRIILLIHSLCHRKQQLSQLGQQLAHQCEEIIIIIS